jgi:hypothetical protein
MSSVSLIPTGPVCEGEEAEASGGEGEGPDSPAKPLLGAKRGERAMRAGWKSLKVGARKAGGPSGGEGGCAKARGCLGARKEAAESKKTCKKSGAKGLSKSSSKTLSQV